jgi:hypothetical protein
MSDIRQSEVAREWRVMRFENAEGKYAEVGTYMGANAIPVPPGYKLVSSTPMVPASQLRGALEALRGVLSGRVIRDETEDGTPILLDLSTDPATPIRFDRLGGQ